MLQSEERTYVCFCYANPSGSGLHRRPVLLKETKTKLLINNSLLIEGPRKPYIGAGTVPGKSCVFTSPCSRAFAGISSSCRSKLKHASILVEAFIPCQDGESLAI